MTEPSQPEGYATRSELQLAFREAFLWRLSEPAAAQAVRAFGDLLFDLMNESGQWGAASPEDSMVRELRAHARDLANTLGDMERAARELRRSDLEEEDTLAERVSGWVGRLSLVLLDMERHFGHLECGDEEPEGTRP